MKIPDNFKTLTVKKRKEWFISNDRFSPSTRELQLATVFLVKQAQKLLPDDLLRRHASINLRYDEDGFWRAVGRTSEVTTAPVIIPQNVNLSKVLMRHYHLPANYGGDAILSLLSQHYWIINGRRLTSSFVFRYSACRLMHKRVGPVEMAPLKPDQCTRYPVFSSVAVGLSGPYLCQADRRSTRQYNSHH